MSDKISDERLIEWRDSIQWVNSPIPVLREFAEVQVSAINELLERRSAEVKPVRLPKDMKMSDAVKANISSDFMDGYNTRGVMDRKAVEDAGGTVEGDIENTTY